MYVLSAYSEAVFGGNVLNLVGEAIQFDRDRWLHNIFAQSKLTETIGSTHKHFSLKYQTNYWNCLTLKRILCLRIRNRMRRISTQSKGGYAKALSANLTSLDRKIECIRPAPTNTMECFSRDSMSLGLNSSSADPCPSWPWTPQPQEYTLNVESWFSF